MPMIVCNVIVPQLFWFKWFRQNLRRGVHHLDPGQHRHVVRAVRDHRDRLAAPRFPAERAGDITGRPGWTSARYLGTFGLFFTLFLLFIRFLPMIAISEVKGVTPQADPHHPLGGAKHEEPVPDEDAGMTSMNGTCKTLRRDCRVHDSGGHHARGGEGPRRGLHALGRVHAVPGARHGPGDGHEEFEGGLVRVSSAA